MYSVIFSFLFLLITGSVKERHAVANARERTSMPAIDPEIVDRQVIQRL